MAVELTSLNDHALIYRAKLFAAAHFKHLPANKLPGFSKGWVYRFRKRHGIYSIHKHGEAASVSASNVVDGRVDMRKLTDMYPLQDIYNMDETSFFYRADCSRTLSISRNPWMNGGIFKDWLRTLDLRMGLEKRRILLLVDNVSSHMRAAVALWNVRLEFLPKSPTSMLQPLDQGIIACVKRTFTRVKIEDCVDRYVAGLPQQIISIRTAVD
ncbi:Pyruvate decarboxylase like protein [Phytophthora megakarya]|uniref:Pyruvate decarboxylase like protein n=1 Tax=Phytophthora megakarya TaxID=4795 RepID=A0A225VER8_9STRA|nr:Pyruvate decarboxylase like protein [Phytophthora megakarya]